MPRLPLAILLLLPLSALAQTQVPNVFEDGTPATAAEVNENFQYVMENASGGCSATQQDNSVLIECADGTSGVIAGAGTVILYPEGQIGEIPPITAPSAFVVMDANDVILAESTDLGPLFEIDLDEQYEAFLYNDASVGTVQLHTLRHTGGRLYFESEDCTGQPLAGALHNYLFYWEGWGFGIVPLVTPVNLLTKSSVLLGGWNPHTEVYWAENPCESYEAVMSVIPLVAYTPAPEILNAAYPVRLEQLP